MRYIIREVVENALGFEFPLYYEIEAGDDNEVLEKIPSWCETYKPFVKIKYLKIERLGEIVNINGQYIYRTYTIFEKTNPCEVS